MKSKWLWLLGIIVPLAVIASIWIPPLSHYWVPSPTVTPELLEQLRVQPTVARLSAVEEQNLALPLRMNDAEILDAATRLYAGELILKGYPAIAVAPDFNQRDLDKGLPTWALHFGSLAITEIFVRAYEISRDERWLTAAVQHTTGFIDYERRAWLPRGFLWNDHAIAARISVLTRLWRLYREHPDYDPQIGRHLIEHILRCRELLAKASQFTFNTNHGVMQNVALLQIAAVFPGLPDEARYRQLAIQRLDRQLAFYVSGEGVVLEHSAEYHALGVELLERSIGLLEILDEPVPPHWAERLRKAKTFLDLIRLPDDSLPLFGNTHSTPEFPPSTATNRDAQSLCAARAGSHLYPVAGYAVTWHCGHQSSQSVLALSQFVGHGHKHADELSLLTWTRGSRWLTSVGYWPYGIPGGESAYGWGGSNAPHWSGESTAGEREPKLLFSATADNVTFLDASRRSPEGGRFRRQVLQLGDDWWIIVDFASALAGAEAEVLWTFYPGIAVSNGSETGYRATLGPDAMQIGIAGAGPVDHRLVMAEREPWRGWVVKERMPTPASGILVRFPTDTPLATAFHTSDAGLPGNVGIEWIARRSAEDWELAVIVGETPAGRIKRRPDGHLELSGWNSLGDRQLALTAAPDVSAARAAIGAAYAALGTDYPRYREVSPYRVKVSKILLALFAVQTLLFAVLWFYRRRLGAVLQICAAVAWIGGGLGLYLWYFP